MEAGEAADDEGEAIWCISFSLRKHLASLWPRREQKSHLGRLPLFWEVGDGVEEVDGKGEVEVA
jgi:hypothetical protein